MSKIKYSLKRLAIGGGITIILMIISWLIVILFHWLLSFFPDYSNILGFVLAALFFLYVFWMFGGIIDL
jgi:hypothetical protein